MDRRGPRGCPCAPGMPATTERQLVGLISAKNTIEYDDGLQDREPSRILVDQATRFVDGAGTIVER
jgi:hypothetical protein